jgi:Arc-like DNA binding domain
MAKRKPSDTAQMNLRLPESLRKKIEVEAKKNGWSLNRELVRRLEQSFTHQGFEDLIQSTAQKVAMEVDKRFSGLKTDLLNQFNIMKKEEDSNG